MKGVIIAAGFGSRLWGISNQVPKTLLPFGKGTILSQIMQSLHVAGITELIIVVGFNQHYIRDYLSSFPPEIPVTIVENNEWERGNALSVYKVKDLVGKEPFILSMSDHLLRVEALRLMVDSSEDCNLLMVDPYIMANFDLDDATKVLVQQDYIVAIGKELPHYNALDCGIFRLEQDLFPAVEQAVAMGRESISAAITGLIPLQRIKAVTLTKPNLWLDVDTPEAYEFAKSSFTFPIT